uniref:Putative secreted peptide n=1 Tax=Anopheles braziliensis TaxID=58242 RepID=A0A2M3ZU15_9DIPT
MLNSGLLNWIFLEGILTLLLLLLPPPLQPVLMMPGRPFPFGSVTLVGRPLLCPTAPRLLARGTPAPPAPPPGPALPIDISSISLLENFFCKAMMNLRAMVMLLLPFFLTSSRNRTQQ